MTTYQDIVDYLNNNYHDGFTLVKHDTHYTINDNCNYCNYYTISIYKDDYSTTIIIDKGLNKLLMDILNTPVDQRNKPEIKHTIKPVTKRSLANYTIKCLDSADKIIGKINSFILKDFSINTGRILLLLTTFNSSELLQVLSLFKDFDITIKDTKEIVYPKGYAYTLSIKAK